MKKTLTLLFALCALYAQAQLTLSNNAPAQRIGTGYTSPQGVTSNPGDLWISRIGLNGNLWGKRNTIWYQFFQTVDTNSILATQSYVNSHGGSIDTSHFWNLTGNAGTSVANNFIGTTDLKGFRIRTNNIQRLLIDSIGGYYQNTPSIRGYTATRATSVSLFGQSGIFDYYTNGTLLNIINVGDSRGIGGKSNLAQLNTYNFSNNYSSFVQAGFDSATKDYFSLMGELSRGEDNFIEVSSIRGINIVDDSISIKTGNEGTGKVLVSNANGLVSWSVTAFTQSDSVTIYATTPAVGTTYLCTNCSGSAITGRIVSYYGAAWRRIPVSTLIN